MEIEATQKGILYHVTVGQYVDSILTDGIDPKYSKGKFECSWYVTKERILWAIVHVSDRHDCKLNDVYILTAVIDWRLMRRANKVGIYYTKHTFQADTVTHALQFAEGDV